MFVGVLHRVLHCILQCKLPAIWGCKTAVCFGCRIYLKGKFTHVFCRQIPLFMHLLHCKHRYFPLQNDGHFWVAKHVFVFRISRLVSIIFRQSIFPARISSKNYQQDIELPVLITGIKYRSSKNYWTNTKYFQQELPARITGPILNCTVNIGNYSCDFI